MAEFGRRNEKTFLKKSGLNVRYRKTDIVLDVTLLVLQITPEHKICDNQNNNGVNFPKTGSVNTLYFRSRGDLSLDFSSG